jgi:hypothetical protein
MSGLCVIGFKNKKSSDRIILFFFFLNLNVIRCKININHLSSSTMFMCYVSLREKTMATVNS